MVAGVRPVSEGNDHRMSTPPDTIGQRYELGALLGRGGMGEVRAATDRRLGRADWHLYAAQAKLYYVPKPFISRILEKFTEQQLNDLAEASAKKDFVDIGLLLRGEFTISSFLSILENWSRISDIPYRAEEIENTQKIIIEHNMGSKYSYLFKEIYRRLLENVFETKVQFDITDNTIVLTFDKEARPLEKETEC